MFAKKRAGAFGQTISQSDVDRHYIIDKKGNFIEVDPETVGQYVNYKIKRKRVFEGDIYQRYINGRKYRSPLVADMCTCFTDYEEVYYSPFEHFSETVTYEVIGNIQDNPELLRGDE